MLGLTVYADESGTHDKRGNQRGSEVTVVAGYIADKKNWERVTKRWNTTLRKYGVEVFHMSEYWGEKPPYDKWSDAKQKRFLNALIKIARDGTWFAIGGMVATKDWDRLVPQEIKGGTLDSRLNFSHPYHFCFQMLLVRFMEYLKNDIDKKFPRNPGFEEKAAFVFHQQEQFQDIAVADFGVIKSFLDPQDRFSSITFASEKQYIPLQAADLLAFYARRILTHQNQGKPWQDPFERKMEERHNLLLHYFIREQIIRFVETLLAQEKSG